MKYDFDRYFKTQINGNSWECYLITPEELTELDGVAEDDVAITIPDERVLLVTEGYVNKGIIIHELLHIFVKDCHIGSAELDAHGMEEVIATMLQHDLDKFIKTINRLYKRFKSLEGSL